MHHSYAQYSLILRLLHTPPHSRSDEQIRQLMEITQGIKFFSSLSKAVHEACCRVMKCAEYGAMQVVFSFGDEPDSFCVILKGSVAVGIPTWTTMLANKLVKLPTMSSINAPEKGKGMSGLLTKFMSQNRSKTLIPRMRPASPKAQLSPELNEVTILGIGSSFGELGLLRGEKRAATITCKETTTLAVLSKADFDTILRENQAKLLNEKISFLLSVPAFAQWSQAMMSKGSYYFNERNYIKGEVVYREDDPAMEIYVVVEGEFMVISS
jgi:CRP-like cAMP-binding protein